MNPWLIVLIAGLMETGWAIGLKYSEFCSANRSHCCGCWASV